MTPELPSPFFASKPCGKPQGETAFLASQGSAKMSRGLARGASQSKALVWILGAGAGVVILLLGLSIRSLVTLFVAPRQSGAVQPESVEMQNVELRMQNVSAKNEEHGVENHEPEAGPVTAPAPAAPVPVPQQAPEFIVDYQTLREREAGRNAMIKTLREIAKENPESGYAMTEEQLRKFEQSGASLQ